MQQPNALSRTGKFSSSVFGGDGIHPIVVAVADAARHTAAAVSQGESHVQLVRFRWELRDAARGSSSEHAS